MSIHRRTFLQQSMALTGAALTAPYLLPSAPAAPARYKAAIIGHSGRGNFGHGMEIVFSHRSDVRVVAVADPKESGRTRAVQRSHAERGYADYREMLEKEKPDLVSVAPRWTDQHHAMGRAALESGAHVYMEKPFCPSLAEADDLLAVAGRTHRRIAVAHQTRIAPSILFLKQQLEEGVLGDLTQVDAYGKQDRRAGGEDLVVLGTHLLDLMRFLAGDVAWCTARIRQDGHPATRRDIHSPTENIGPIVGDDIHAEFGFENGVVGTFTSRHDLGQTLGPWGLMVTGTKGQIRVTMDMVPYLTHRASGEWKPDTGWKHPFMAMKGDPSLDPANRQGSTSANRRVVDDWLLAIAEDREPVCSGEAAMKSLEMISGVFQAGIERQRIPFPLTRRQHPLA